MPTEQRKGIVADAAGNRVDEVILYRGHDTGHPVNCTVRPRERRSRNAVKAFR